MVAQREDYLYEYEADDDSALPFEDPLYYSGPNVSVFQCGYSEEDTPGVQNSIFCKFSKTFMKTEPTDNQWTQNWLTW